MPAKLATVAVLVTGTSIVGGWTWTVLCLVGLLAQARTDRGVAAIAGVAPSLIWLAFARLTGDRELFFPFTMYLATYITLPGAGRRFERTVFGGALVVASFTAIRLLQAATVRVLAVELVVAAAVLALALGAYRTGPQSIPFRVTIAALASLMAYAGLAI